MKFRGLFTTLNWCIVRAWARSKRQIPTYLDNSCRSRLLTYNLSSPIFVSATWHSHKTSMGPYMGVYKIVSGSRMVHVSLFSSKLKSPHILIYIPAHFFRKVNLCKVLHTKELWSWAEKKLIFQPWMSRWSSPEMQFRLWIINLVCC